MTQKVHYTPDDWFNIGFDSFFIPKWNETNMPPIDQTAFAAFDRGWLAADDYQQALMEQANSKL